VTIPVGFVVVPVLNLMVALKVTGWFTVDPAGDGNDDVTLTVVAWTPTFWTSAVAPEALPAKFVSPLV
jgi:hypothetical protein